jgi:hypothetical protein
MCHVPLFVSQSILTQTVAAASFLSRPEFAGDLQSLSWSSMAVGGIFGSLLGGFALSNLSIHVIYLVFSSLPFFQLVSCIFVEDSPKGFQSVADEHKYVDDPSVLSAFAETSSSETFRYEVTRRRRGSRKNKKRRTPSRQVGQKQNKSIESSLSLRSAFFSLCTAFKQPTILR